MQVSNQGYKIEDTRFLTHDINDLDDFISTYTILDRRGNEFKFEDREITKNSSFGLYLDKDTWFTSSFYLNSIKNSNSQIAYSFEYSSYTNITITSPSTISFYEGLILMMDAVIVQIIFISLKALITNQYLLIVK